MGNAGDIEGQDGPSGVKKFEENCEHNMELGQGGTLPNYPVPGIMDYAPSLPRPYQSPFNPELLQEMSCDSKKGVPTAKTTACEFSLIGYVLQSLESNSPLYVAYLSNTDKGRKKEGKSLKEIRSQIGVEAFHVKIRAHGTLQYDVGPSTHT